MTLCTCNAQLQPHRAMLNVCPVYGQPAEEWAAYGQIIPCDDCHRTDGTHDPEVEH